MLRKPTEIVPIQVRMREGLRRKLEASAHKQDLSLNSEIVSRLESTFDSDGREATYANAIEVLAGGGESARLLKLISSALRLISRKYGADRIDAMRAFAVAVSEITQSNAGGRIPYTEVEVDALSDVDRSGVFCAEVLLQEEKMPPVIDPMFMAEICGQQSKSMSLADLGKAWGY